MSTRRRGAELDDAIRSAVLELLAAGGPSAVTMEAVAVKAKTSKPVLYRRWSDGQALLRDTLIGIAASAIPHQDTGSYRGDLLAMLRGWATLFTGPSADLLRNVIATAVHDELLATAFRTGVIDYRKREMTAMLARGIERGEVRADVPVEIARELGQSLLWHRLLITGDPITDDLIVTLVDEVLVPFVCPHTP